MNNMPSPYLPPQFIPNVIPNQQIQEEIIKLKKEISILKERIKNLEEKEHNDYLKKDDGLYMM